jgi:hypothetical protein
MAIVRFICSSKQQAIEFKRNAARRQLAADIGGNHLNSPVSAAPEVVSKFVFVGPGQSAVTVTPVPRSSRARPFVNDNTNAFDA